MAGTVTITRNTTLPDSGGKADLHNLIDTATATCDISAYTGNVSLDTGTFTFNESGADKDARFEGDTDVNLLFLDASTDRVGIGTNAPSALFDVDGTLRATDIGVATASPSTKLHILLDDATANAVVDMLTIEKTTSGTPAANIGLGIVFKIEDAGGSEEQASIDVALTDKTDGGEDCDITFSQNLAGAITETLKLDVDAQNPTYKTDTLALIKTGSYTGDGATSKGITGVGFTPKYVKIWSQTTSDGGAIIYHETTPDIIDDISGGASVETDGTSINGEANTIISLDTDGFTVDDDGADAHPNKNGSVYNYICLG